MVVVVGGVGEKIEVIYRDKMNVLEFKCELTCRGETENPEVKMMWSLADRHGKNWD